VINSEDFLAEYESLQSLVDNSVGESTLLNVLVPDNDNSRRRIVLYHRMNNEQVLIKEQEFSDVDALYFYLMPEIMEIFVRSSKDIKEEEYVSKTTIDDEETAIHIFSSDKAILELIGIEVSVIDWLIDRKNNIVNETVLDDYDFDQTSNFKLLIDEGKNIFKQLRGMFPDEETIVKIQEELSRLENSLVSNDNDAEEQNFADEKVVIEIPKGVDPNSFIQPDFLQDQIAEEMKKSLESLPIEEMSKKVEYEIDPNSIISPDVIKEQLEMALAEDKVGENKTKIDPNSFIQPDFLQEQISSELQKSMAQLPFDELDADSNNMDDEVSGFIENDTLVSNAISSDYNAMLEISEMDNQVIVSESVPEPTVLFDDVRPGPATLFEQIFVDTKELREQLGDLFFKGFCINRLQERGVMDLSLLVRDMEDEYRRVITVGLEKLIGNIVLNEGELSSNINVKTFEMPGMVNEMLNSFNQAETFGNKSLADQLKESQMKLEIGNVLREMLNDNVQLEEISKVTNENLQKRASVLDNINVVVEKFISERF